MRAEAMTDSLARASDDRVKPLRFTRFLPALALAVAILELALHLRQTRPRDDASDYLAVRAALSNDLTPNDLIVFAPAWTEPVGRKAFGDVLGMERAGYADTSRYARIFEVSRDLETLWSLSAIPVREVRSFGGLSVREHIPSAPELVRDDLLLHIPTQAQVFAGDRACPWTQGRAEAGPWGVAKPSATYACGGVWSAKIMLLDGGYQSRYCMYTPPGTRIEFEDVEFAKQIVVHLGFHRAQEQAAQTEGVQVTASVNAELPSGVISRRELGKGSHREGEGSFGQKGWSEFRIETPALDGQTGDLTLAVTGSGPVCLEASTR
jgi:hypothetical protein